MQSQFVTAYFEMINFLLIIFYVVTICDDIVFDFLQPLNLRSQFVTSSFIF